MAKKGLGVITEEQEEEALGVVDSPEENCYSNMVMIQPRKKKSRNKSTSKKSHREPPVTEDDIQPVPNTVTKQPGNKIEIG